VRARNRLERWSGRQMELLEEIQSLMTDGAIDGDLGALDR
jgi:hypothetical protein